MIGHLNPCPFHVGGGPTNASRAYFAMRRAVGKGGSAQDDLGIDGLWRRCRAKGVGAIYSVGTRAVFNWWPHLATDALPSFARILGLVQATDETTADFRARVWIEWVTKLQVDIPALAAQLLEFDARLSILEPTYTTTTQSGRVLAPLTPGDEEPDWGLTTNESAWPNYSTDMIVFVRLTLGYSGAPGLNDQRLIERVKEYLRNSLPSWVDFRVLTEVGFHLGHSPLGRTGFTL